MAVAFWTPNIITKISGNGPALGKGGTRSELFAEKLILFRGLGGRRGFWYQKTDIIKMSTI